MYGIDIALDENFVAYTFKGIVQLHVADRRRVQAFQSGHARLDGTQSSGCGYQREQGVGQGYENDQRKVYVQAKGELRKELVACLRSGRILQN